MGLDGAALGFVACTATNTLLLTAYTAGRDWARRLRPDATWRGLSMEAFASWGVYLSLALPALAQIAAEWLAYEVVIIMAGAPSGPQMPGGGRQGCRVPPRRMQTMRVPPGAYWLRLCVGVCRVLNKCIHECTPPPGPCTHPAGLLPDAEVSVGVTGLAFQVRRRLGGRVND